MAGSIGVLFAVLFQKLMRDTLQPVHALSVTSKIGSNYYQHSLGFVGKAVQYLGRCLRCVFVLLTSDNKKVIEQFAVLRLFSSCTRCIEHASDLFLLSSFFGFVIGHTGAVN